MLVFLLLSVGVQLSLSQSTTSLSAHCSYTFYVPKSSADQCEGMGIDGVVVDLKEENRRLATLYTELQKQVTYILQHLLEDNSKSGQTTTPGTESEGKMSLWLQYYNDRLGFKYRKKDFNTKTKTSKLSNTNINTLIVKSV